MWVQEETERDHISENEVESCLEAYYAWLSNVQPIQDTSQKDQKSFMRVAPSADNV